MSEQDHPNQQKQARSGEKKRPLKWLWNEFCRDIPGYVAAIATVALAIFAVMAWLDARAQLIAGNGAFVFLERVDFIRDTHAQGVQWDFVPRFRNSGNTPAARLDIHVNYASTPNQMANGYYLTDFPAESVPVVLGPKATTETSFFSAAPEFFTGGGFVYIWGWARYRDTIEGRNHISRFCYRITGWQGDPRTAYSDNAAPFMVSDNPIPSAERRTGGDTRRATIFNPIPFQPIYSLCNEGNCMDGECTRQAAKYGRVE